MKVKGKSEVAQVCLTLSDPMDCSLPGSSICGIFQARVLEWGAIAFSVTMIQVIKKKKKKTVDFIFQKSFRFLEKNEQKLQRVSI